MGVFVCNLTASEMCISERRCLIIVKTILKNNKVTDIIVLDIVLLSIYYVPGIITDTLTC